MGAMGLWVRGMHSGEARTISNYHEAIVRLWQRVLLEDLHETYYETMRLS